MNKDVRAVMASVAWTSVLALAVARTMVETTELTVWVVLVSQVAVMLTTWLVFETVVERATADAMHELRAMDDRTVERVASRLAAVVREDCSVSPLR